MMENNEIPNEINEIKETVNVPVRKKKKAKMSRTLGIVCAVICLIAGGIGGAVGMRIYDEIASYERAQDLYDKISTVEYIIDNEYLYDYDEKRLADSAAFGMVLGLGDPYTMYYAKEDFKSFEDDGNGDFVGIGVVVVANQEENTIEIESVVNGGPAEKAGVLPGDVLKAVDGEVFTALEFTEAVAKVRGVDIEGGSEGHKFLMTVVRDGEELELEIVREKIHTDSVESKMLEDKMGYLRITGFKTSDGENPDTFTEFKNHFEKLKTEGAEKLIIDVRDNGGGDLQEVASIIDMIVPKGTIMYAEYKDGNREYLYSDKEEINMPMAILVNGNSASASELLTGALKDYEKATVIGTKTYGKGVMQIVYPFTDGSGMVATVAKYYTPKGTCVQDEGITPDIEVELNSEKTISNLTYEEDNQLQKAVEFLKQK